MGFREILLILLGFIGLKYVLLGSATFETSFLAGIIYNYTALIVIAVFGVIQGVKKHDVTPGFLDAFKHIAKKVITYSVGVALLTPLWNFVLAEEDTQRRTDIKNRDINGVTDEQYAEFVETNPNLESVSKDKWVENQIASVEFFSSAKIVTAIYLLAYVVIGLFISIIASFLWTKVWFVQQRHD